MNGQRQRKPWVARVRADRVEKAFKKFSTMKADIDMSLWEHQKAPVEAVRRFIADSVEKIKSGKCASGAIVMPTGSGKTIIAAEIAKALGLRAVILAPTVTIAEQHFDEVRDRVPGRKSSIYYSKNKDLSGDIIVTTYQSAVSLVKRGSFPKNIDIVLYDEAHNSLSPERGKLHGQIAPVEIGLTATPAYDEERHIWNFFDEVIYEIDIQEAIEMGVLSSLRGYVIETDVDVRGVRLKCGNGYLNEKDAERHLNVIARNQAARDFYLDGFSGVPTVAYCLSRKHAEEFAAFLRASDVKATFIHGDLTQRQRKYRMKAFENGSYDVLTSRDILIQGWDSERVAMSLNLRPTYSRVVKTHIVGRVIRARPNKESGIVVEFQDRYSQGQQPILVHHLFDQLHYRQGGLVAAPERKIKDEEGRVRRGRKVIVLGNLKVTSKVAKTVEHLVRRVAPLVDSDADFRDPKLLREILESCGEFDYRSAKFDEFYNMHFNHPSFSGTGRTLLRKHLGINSKTALRMNKEDYENFINFVFEIEVCADDLVDSAVMAELDPELAPQLPFDLLEMKRKQEAAVKALSLCTPHQELLLKMRVGLGEEDEHTVREMASIWGCSATTITNRMESGLKKIRQKKELHRLNLSDDIDTARLIQNDIRRALDQTIPPEIRNKIVEEILGKFSAGMPEIFIMFAMDPSLHPHTRINAGRKAIASVLSLGENISSRGIDERLAILQGYVQNMHLPDSVRNAAENELVNLSCRLIESDGLGYVPHIPMELNAENREKIKESVRRAAESTPSGNIWTVFVHNTGAVRMAAGLEYLEKIRGLENTYPESYRYRYLANFGENVPKEVRREAQRRFGKVLEEERKTSNERLDY